MNLTLTLTPNRDNRTPIFARSVRYERKGDKLQRIETSHTRSRLVPIITPGESKDWTGIPSGKATQAITTGNRTYNTAADKEAWLAGGTVKRDGGLATISVKPTAKRDWLIASGYITPGKELTPVKLDWCGGYDRIEFREGTDSTTHGWFDATHHNQPLSWESCLDGDTMVFGGDFYPVIADEGGA